MCLLAALHRIDNTATPMFRASRKQEFHDGQKPGGFPSQLGMAEAGGEIVDNDLRLTALFGAGGEFAAGEDLEKFRDLVSASHQLAYL